MTGVFVVFSFKRSTDTAFVVVFRVEIKYTFMTVNSIPPLVHSILEIQTFTGRISVGFELYHTHES